MRNKVNLNIINDFGDEWYGLIFEEWQIKTPFSFNHVKDSLPILEHSLEIGVLEAFYDGYTVLHSDKTVFENVFDLTYLKEVILQYKKEIDEAMNKVGILEYDIIFNFYNDNNNYLMNEED